MGPLGSSLLQTSTSSMVVMDEGSQVHMVPTGGEPACSYKLSTGRLARHLLINNKWNSRQRQMQALILNQKQQRWWDGSSLDHPRTNSRYIGSSDLSAKTNPWAFKDGNPQKRIAALELYGSLLLLLLVLQQSQDRS